MKAAVNSTYGPPEVVQITDVEKPAPKDNEVLIKVRAASVNPADFHIIRGTPLLARPMMGGILKPKITRPGIDVAGQIESVGKSVTQFKPGDEVFGACRGACAEYVCAAEDKLALKPANVSFEDAAAAPVAALTAIQGLRDKGRIQPGQKVLIDGASGGVGTFAVQIAKSFGAEVTAVCSTQKMDTARSLGADHVLDYTREDCTRSGQRYNLILAANAYHSIFDYQRALSADGTFVMVGGGWTLILQTMLLGSLFSRMGRKKMCFFITRINQKDLLLLKDLLATGKVVSIIDRRYPLSGVAEAIRYLEAGHARGKVAITI